MKAMKRKVITLFLVGMLAFASACGSGMVENSSDSTSVGDSENSSVVEVVEHVDENDDGTCEECGESTLRTFNFFAINDLHGKFTDTEEQIGIDELSTYLKQEKTENPNTILLSSGDMWQGGAESNSTKGLIITDWMNQMDFASMTLGNHEYDWGEDYIEANAELAEFPFLAINIYDRTTNERVDYCDASIMIEQDGAKIGIIGAMGNCYSSISSDKTKDVYFKTGGELTTLVKEESTRLKEAGADFIVLSMHDDMSGYDANLSQGFIDLVFEGHTHQAYTKQDTYGVYHLQNGGDNKTGISKATVTINIANESAENEYAGIVTTSTYENLADDPMIEQLLEKYKKEIEISTKSLGFNSKYRNSNEVSQIVANLYYQAGVEKWGDKYDIVLGGGSLNLRSPYNIPIGEVTYGHLQMILPFDNYLVLCSIQGRDLQRRFFNNGEYKIGYGEYGSSVKANIELNRTYYVVVDSWSSLYSPNKLTEIEKYDDNKTFARDLLAKHIKNGGLQDNIPTAFTSIPEVLRIGGALARNAETTEVYKVKGKVVSVPNTTYGNIYIEDEQGNRLYLYGLYDQAGKRYDGMTNPPKVDDNVVVYGKIKNYNGTTVEIMNAILVE